MTKHGKPVTEKNLVVVGADFTGGSKTALARAAQIAAATKAKLVAVHVVPDAHVPQVPPAGDWRAPSEPRPEDEMIAAAKDAERRLAGEVAGVGAEAVVRTGKPHEALARFADESGARLLVLGVRAALEPHESFFLGSTSERALRVGSTPVLLARSEPEKAYGRILCPVDLGDMSLSVLKLVAQTFPDAAYDLVHFLHPTNSHEVTSKERHDSFAASLAGLALTAGLSPVRTRVRAFVAEAREGVIAEIRARRPDLVAMGTHARSGVMRVVLGSVADYVIHAAQTVDVLVVPPARG